MTSSIWDIQTQAAINGMPYKPAGVLFCVDGTAYPGAPFPPFPLRNDGQGFWAGFSSGIAGGLMNVADGLWDSQFIGYPAATVPMWPSVQTGRAALVNAIASYASAYRADPNRGNGSFDGLVIAMSGYSQGAMVTNQVYTLDFLPDTGALHPLLPYLWRMYNFGDIFRTPGLAYGNQLAGLPMSIIQDGEESGGIGGPLDLTVAQTQLVAPDGQPIVKSSANKGDIYTAAPVGLNPWTSIAKAGKTAYRFFEIIMQPTFVDVVSAAAVLETPVSSIEEMINAMSFFAAGTNAPHWHYFPQMDAVIDELVSIGSALPHERGF